MIIIYGEFTIDPAARDELIAAAITMQEETAKEAGCLRYVFSTDLARDDVIHVQEHWDNADALGAHMASAHMAAFGAALAGKVKGASLKKYDASGDGSF